MLVLQSCVSVAPPVVTEIPTAPVAPHVPAAIVKSGLEVFIENQNWDNNLKYGLLANQTCVDRNLVHGVTLLPGYINLVLIMSPEHGLFGAENAGDHIGDEIESSSGIKAVTTYRQGQDKIIEMIADLDVILLDLQDIGVRSYTYIYSMSYIMKAAAAKDKKVIILDRPNPINGVQMEGNILKPEFASGVGRYPIPYRHGMTPGELAQLFNEEFGINCNLEVVKMEGWTRDMWFDETGLPWVPTSPHVPDASTILPMISTGTYGELHVLSEGVGITIPFEFSGGPWITNPHEFADALQAIVGGGVIFRPTFVKPYYGRYKGQVCGGVQLYVRDREVYKPYLAGLQILAVHQELYPEIDLFANEGRWNMFNKVMGDDQIMLDIQAGKDPAEMEAGWLEELNNFAKMRQKYLLYN
ncbi:MAG: DUF1343 domain-containing protein [Candidatus Marinimicrobia bacterium]|jgi:uncharacterized protein YbbC (DUF1343 family)|nr:DUF1343 domain-containing protein [Candidatus Neomarinimicrobiota bacterium]MBT3679810.1 DUF1343 domain-containing protein [Candidatus Neomarinimicrobiota bacterium]MBT4253979.1 DUF1343 domain-containing protein [Candidatus Neomarinimicrobiota bacterium]MBT4481449.1 DUF1343 domain-containing protein [Candidatus Neomarinimicrobiota bacterium]MBT5236489.1 DUF1343 domain-containing protein [Candidatus Neomarinimicrobiota bacterium]